MHNPLHEAYDEAVPVHHSKLLYTNYETRNNNVKCLMRVTQDRVHMLPPHASQDGTDSRLQYTSCPRRATASRKAPAVVRRGLMSIAVFCCSQGLWYKLDGDDHGDLPSSRERSIREQAVDRNNSGQDISHLVDGDGRRTVREERNRLRLQDDGAVEFN